MFVCKFIAFSNVDMEDLIFYQSLRFNGYLSFYSTYYLYYELEVLLYPTGLFLGGSGSLAYYQIMVEKSAHMAYNILNRTAGR